VYGKPPLKITDLTSTNRAFLASVYGSERGQPAAAASLKAMLDDG
jgi:hypothetical protein